MKHHHLVKSKKSTKSLHPTVHCSSPLQLKELHPVLSQLQKSQLPTPPPGMPSTACVTHWLHWRRVSSRCLLTRRLHCSLKKDPFWRYTTSFAVILYRLLVVYFCNELEVLKIQVFYLYVFKKNLIICIAFIECNKCSQLILTFFLNILSFAHCSKKITICAYENCYYHEKNHSFSVSK